MINDNVRQAHRSHNNVIQLRGPGSVDAHDLEERASRLSAMLDHLDQQYSDTLYELRNLLDDVGRNVPAPPPVVEQQLLTTQQAADALAIGGSTVRQLIRSGEIGSVTIGTSRRIPVPCLHKYVAGLLVEYGTAGE